MRRYGVEADTPGDVVGVPLIFSTGADGVVDVTVHVPPEAGLTWTARAQTVDGERREIAVREGLVLPADGRTYAFSAPVVPQDAAAGTFVLEHDTVVDHGDGTFTVDGTQE